MKKFHLFLWLFPLVIYGQVIYTPVSSSVYNFLERASLKKIIEYHDEVKPLSRKNIAFYLQVINKNSADLNPVEKDELVWFVEEYAYELKQNDKERYFLYKYTDSLFSIRISPNFGYGINYTAGKPNRIRWPGLTLYGQYSDNFGAFFEYKDVGEYGDNFDLTKKFSPATGANYFSEPNGIEHSDIRGSISLNWSWGSVSLLKDYNNWGHGKFGQLILSSKAPSFPHIQLMLQPAKWLRFYYLHGWLNSMVLDSNNAFLTHQESIQPNLHLPLVNKYIAANLLSVTPWEWMDFSIGNSFVYSGELRPEAFIPFMYYKGMDHDLGRQGFDDGNGMIYTDVKFNYWKNVELYGTLLIDVLELRDILKNKWYTSWFGYTLGGKLIDVGIDNLDLSVEYTKLDPWVYENRDATVSYKHLGYPLGDWLGQNAEQFRIQFDYIPLRGLNLNLWSEWIRKGGLKDIYYAYVDILNLPFLYSPLRKDFRLGFEASYEIYHDLFTHLSCEFSDVSDQDPLRTPNWQLGKISSFGFSIYYGLQ